MQGEAGGKSKKDADHPDREVMLAVIFQHGLRDRDENEKKRPTRYWLSGLRSCLALHGVVVRFSVHR